MSEEQLKTVGIKIISSTAKRLSITDRGREIARAWIFFISNDLHDKQYALLEDVFVHEEYRGQGYGKQIVNEAIREAKKSGCYKIIGTSRYGRENVHSFYRKLGFAEWGKEFRMDL